MTDVAQILGVGSSKTGAAPSKPPPPLPASHQPSRAMKLQSLPREVMDMWTGKQDPSTADLPTTVPTFTGQPQQGPDTVRVGNKWITTTKPARKWVWAPFASSSRTDGTLFHHWVRAHVEYPDYPYARFDIHLDPVTYSEDEYKRHLQTDEWTKSETDQLLELARIFELRWPVIHDRWVAVYGHERKIEDLQHRYYQVAAKLNQTRISHEAAAEVQTLVASTPASTLPEDARIAAEGLLMETAAARALASCEPELQPLIQNIGTGSTNKLFDLEYERERRAHMEALWKRSKEEEFEEAELRKELKLVDAQLRKLKKSGGHVLAAATGATSLLSSAASSRNPSRSVSPSGMLDAGLADLEQGLASTAPVPVAQTPYLQSARLVPPAVGGPAGLNKTLLARMDTVLEELKIPPNIIPTKRACDLYDAVRKDVLTLLILQKNVIQKEGLVQNKRLKLAKLGGNIRVVDEETLMGLSPAPAAAGAVRTKPKSLSKPKAASSAAAPPAKLKPPPGNSETATPKAMDLNKEGPGGKHSRKPAGVKRKRKAESKSPAPAGTSMPSTATSSVTFPGPQSNVSNTAMAAAVPAAMALPTVSSLTTDDCGKPAKKRAKKSA